MSSDGLVPKVYGGDCDYAALDATAGFSMSAVSLAKLVASLEVPGAVLSDASHWLMLEPWDKTLPVTPQHNITRIGFDGGRQGVRNGWKIPIPGSSGTRGTTS